MKVLVIGAHGSVGKILVKKLQESQNHFPIAMVRKKDQLEDFKEQGVEAVLADLEGSISDISQAAKNADVIAFTAGSGGSTGADKTMSVDLDGTVKAVEAAKDAGIDRFVIVSALGSQQWLEDPHPDWLDQLGPYYPAQFYVDQWLKNRGLDYTIVRTGLLSDDEAAGKVKLAKTLVESGKITRSDVAQIIVDSIDNDDTRKKEFDVINGDTPIKEALKELEQ